MKNRLPAVHAPDQCASCKHPSGHWATCRWHPENLAIVRERLHLDTYIPTEADGTRNMGPAVCVDPDGIAAVQALRGPAAVLTRGTTEPDLPDVPLPMGMARGCEHEGQTATWDALTDKTMCDNCGGHAEALDEDAEDDRIVRELERETDGYERELLPMGEGVELPAGQTVELYGNPQIPFQVHHFVTPTKGARVESIRVGTVELMACVGAVPSECFAPGGKALRLKRETVVPGVSVHVTMTNPTGRLMRVGGMMIGNVMRRAWDYGNGTYHPTPRGMAPELARLRVANRRALAVRSGDPGLVDELDELLTDGYLEDLEDSEL